MTRPRITIARLLAIVLFVGLGLAGLINDRRKNAEIAVLSALIARREEEFKGQRECLTAIIRDQRDQLDYPRSYVTAVDNDRREVVVNVTARQGAHPRMTMAVFDAASPHIPDEKLKGTIVLSQVGEQSSRARILKANDSVGPIRVGDIVCSPLWSPNSPTRFALVGKFDVNCDGKDDHDELRRMIEEAGGVIDFDFPPPDVGKVTGQLLPRIDWYVFDDRMSCPGINEISIQQDQIDQRVGQLIKQARLNGIRPMPIHRLLAILGDGHGTRDTP